MESSASGENEPKGTIEAGRAEDCAGLRIVNDRRPDKHNGCHGAYLAVFACFQRLTVAGVAKRRIRSSNRLIRQG